MQVQHHGEHLQFGQQSQACVPHTDNIQCIVRLTVRFSRTVCGEGRDKVDVRSEDDEDDMIDGMDVFLEHTLAPQLPSRDDDLG